MTDQRLRAIVADDEPLARELLLEFLALEGDVEIVAVCDNGLDTVRAVSAHQPDVLFLDVEMPKLDGFEALELLKSPVAVVFVTAYDGYAVRAFETEAVDYLLKPFGPERLRQSLERVRRHLAPQRAPQARGATTGAYLSRVAVKDGTEIGVIPTSELVWARSEDDYVRLKTTTREWWKHQTLSELEASLDPESFVRVHRTCLVNVTFVKRIEPETRDRHLVVLEDGTTLPASRAGEKRLREVLGI